MYLEYLEQALTLGIFWCGLLFAILAIVLACYIATVLSIDRPDPCLNQRLTSASLTDLERQESLNASWTHRAYDQGPIASAAELPVASYLTFPLPKA
jgi:hypothetical protein